MRTLIALVLACTLVGASRPAHAYNQTLKTIGIISTFVGGGLFLTGIICLGAYYGTNNPPGLLFDAGVGLTVFGALGLGAGIPLWIIGSKGGSAAPGRAMLYPAANGLRVEF